MKISLPKIRLPELAHLSEEEQQAILTSCMETDVMRLLQRRCMSGMRVCWGLGVAGIITNFVLVSFGVNPKICLWAVIGIILLGIMCLPAWAYVFHVRSGQLLRKLIGEKLNNAA